MRIVARRRKGGKREQPETLATTVLRVKITFKNPFAIPAIRKDYQAGGRFETEAKTDFITVFHLDSTYTAAISALDRD